MVVEALPQGRGRADRLRRLLDAIRNKASEGLDGTASFRRRSGEDGEAPAYRGGGSGINVPASAIVGFVLYLVAQTAGGIWWAATMQTRLDNLVLVNGQLWQKTETQELLLNKMDNGLDERVRTKAREVLTDWGYIHVSRKGQE